ncbi:MAG: hypothetical protein RRY40_01060 [Oscillospiraceae bacterium]
MKSRRMQDFTFTELAEWLKTHSTVSGIYRRMVGENKYIWLDVRLRCLSENGKRYLFYAAMTDVTAQMEGTGKNPKLFQRYKNQILI